MYVIEVETFETLSRISFLSASYILIMHCHLKYILTFRTGGGSLYLDIKMISRMEFMIFEWPLRYFHEKPSANAQKFFLLINTFFINVPHRHTFDVHLVML